MLQSPYYVFTINGLCLAAYMVTWGLVKGGIISANQHLRFWNLLLFFFLLIAGGFGLLLAISINYKIEIPGIETLLKWHVNSGIALVVVSFLHFIRHSRYYLEYFAKNQPDALVHHSEGVAKEAEATKEPIRQKRLFLLPFGLGVTVLVSQTVLLREFFAVFYGNEFVAGTLLAIWMVLTGTGAWAGRKQQKHPMQFSAIATTLLLLAFSALFLLLLLPIGKQWVFITGSMPEVLSFVVFSMVLLSPFCLVSGWLFVRMVETFTMYNLPGVRVYSLEAIGSMAGGLFFSLVMVWLFNPFNTLLGTFLIVLVCALPFIKGKKRIVIVIGSALAIVLFLALQPYYHLATRQFPGQQLIFRKQTPYSYYTITRSGSQVNFFADNALVSSSDNVVQAEEPVHYAMLQHDHPEKVLLIGGALTGALKEVWKYPLVRLDYVDYDNAPTKLAERFGLMPAVDSVLRTFSLDPYRYIRTCKEKYDVIIMIQPEPVTLKANRLYSVGFFAAAARCLNPGGVFSFSLMPVVNYAGDESRQVHSIIYKTLSQLFKNVLIIPGEKDYFIASSRRLSDRITALAEAKNLQAAYVNRFYLNDISIHSRSKQILEMMQDKVPVNSNLNPSAAYAGQGYWLSYLGSRNSGAMMIGIFILVTCILLFIKPTGRGLFIAGFTSASVEITLLFVFQVMLGYMYQALALFFSFFMGGLALGAWLSGKLNLMMKWRGFVKMHFLLTTIVIAITGMIYLMGNNSLPSIILWITTGLLLFVTAAITGWQFTKGVIIDSGHGLEASGRLYFADLSGSALGALLTSVWMVPVLGLTGSGLVLTGLNLLVGMGLLMNFKNIK